MIRAPRVPARPPPASTGHGCPKKGFRVRTFCGIDSAEDHHDVALVDEAGQLMAKRRISDTVEGFEELLQLLADVGDDPDDPIAGGDRTLRGLLVAALRGSGRQVFAINPMAVARYRERHSVARKKSDHVDAMTLAGILRTDAHAHRPLPTDTDLARAIAVLARAHQDAIRRRTRASNALRSLLREYFPSFLAAFADRTTNLAGRDARAVLGIALTPTAAADLPRTRITAALRRAGRQRGIDQLARRIQQALRQPQLHQPPLVEQAMGEQARALLAVLDAERDNVDRLGQAVAEAFAQHPDYQIITSFPGLGDELGARLLAEIGDDRAWFTDTPARCRPTPDRHPSPAPPGAASPSPVARSRTTSWLQQGPYGRSARPPKPGPRAPTTSNDATTATSTPPHYGTCSTACSDSSTTASKHARPTTHSRHSPPPPLSAAARRLSAIGGLIRVASLVRDPGVRRCRAGTAAVWSGRQGSRCQ
nr:hypothetical protein GCM10010200_048620 [Actinomadura rugatobispora]